MHSLTGRIGGKSISALAPSPLRVRRSAAARLVLRVAAAGACASGRVVSQVLLVATPDQIAVVGLQLLLHLPREAGENVSLPHEQQLTQTADLPAEH